MQGLIGQTPHSPLDHYEQRPLCVQGRGKREAGSSPALSRGCQAGALGWPSASASVRLPPGSFSEVTTAPEEYTFLTFRLLGFIDCFIDC